MNASLPDESEEPTADGADESGEAEASSAVDKSAEVAAAAAAAAASDDEESGDAVPTAKEPSAEAEGEPDEEVDPEEAERNAERVAAEVDDAYAAALAAAESGSAPDLGLVGGGAPEKAKPSVQNVEFAQIPDLSTPAREGSIDMLMDIKLPITVELGRTETFVRDILEYGAGSVIELDKLAGDPVDVLVNGRLVAKGEVVVVDDHFGVRITLLLTPEERVRSLA